MRIGFGYDVHRFGDNRKCILGGVTFPGERGLVGHSDADVLTHAIIDALLGAAGLPDIGELFPDTDPHYEGANSIALLASVGEKVRAAGYRIGNIDCVIAAEKPKIASAKEAMKACLSRALFLSPDAICVKGKTEEGLGFTGCGEGIKAWAVCLLEETENRGEEKFV